MFTKPLPSGDGRILDMLLQVLKYNVLCDCTVGGRKIAPAPKVTPPIALFQLRELALHFVGGTPLHFAHQVADR